MIEIKPFTIQFKGVATHIGVKSNGYFLGQSEQVTFNVAFLVVNEEGHVEGDAPRYKCLREEALTMEGKDFANWGKDDNYVFDWIISKLSLKKA